MAIVHEHDRPAMAIVQDTYRADVTGAWADLAAADVRERLNRAIRATGRLEASGMLAPFLGTAILVAPDRVAVFLPTVPNHLTMRVDFGREAVPRDSTVVAVSDLEPGPGGLMFGSVDPDAVADREPLPLAEVLPADLVGRRVAAIGYPAQSRSVDPALRTRLFGDVYNVKRLLPGVIMEGSDASVVHHDCTTLPGCAGAPIVDLQTGQALAIHTSGRQHGRNSGVPAPVVRDALGAGAGAELPGPPDGVDEPLDLPDATLDEPSVPLPTELPADRPVIRLGESASAGGWIQVITHPQRRPYIDAATRAVGRLATLGPDGRVLRGTAFVVGPDRVVASAEDSAALLDHKCVDAELAADVWAFVDFSDALGRTPGSVLVRVRGAAFVHPWFRVMLLRTDPLPSGLTTLTLAASQPGQLAQRSVMVVCMQHDRLALLPGQAVQLGRHPERGTTTLVHDCATAAGARGAPLIDLATGTVWGVQCSTADGPAMAEPTWEIARDPRVWPHALPFRPDPTPRWLGLWDADDDSAPVTQTTTASAALRPGTPQWEALHLVLLSTYLKPGEIVFVGAAAVDPSELDDRQSAAQVWSDLMRKAAGRGTLGMLLEALVVKFPHRQADFDPFR